MSKPRALLAAGVGIVAVVLGVVFLPGLGGDSADEDDTARVVRSKLTLERFPAPRGGRGELLVSLPAAELNKPELTGGERLVLLRCFDERAAVVIRAPADWPLLEEPGLPPHIHQPADPGLLERIRRCELSGPGILFEGEASATAQQAAPE